jgi:hypothetical protein
MTSVRTDTTSAYERDIYLDNADVMDDCCNLRFFDEDCDAVEETDDDSCCIRRSASALYENDAPLGAAVGVMVDVDAARLGREARFKKDGFALSHTSHLARGWALT